MVVFGAHGHFRLLPGILGGLGFLRQFLFLQQNHYFGSCLDGGVMSKALGIFLNGLVQVRQGFFQIPGIHGFRFGIHFADSIKSLFTVTESLIPPDTGTRRLTLSGVSTSTVQFL